MPPGLIGLLVLLALSAVIGAVLLARADRAGTGFVLGILLGPIGVAIILARRHAWEAHWSLSAGRKEDARKEQAFREWRGYD
jgi:hypothetical protein